MMNDSEYLSRPILTNVVYNIESGFIQIYNENTCFVNVSNVVMLKQKDFLERYQKLMRLCKELGIKRVYKYSFKKRVLECWDDYDIAVKEYNKIVEEVRQKALKIKERGIHIGWSDDVALNEVLKYSAKLESYFYGGSVISRVDEINRRIEQQISDIEGYICQGSNFESYTIYL